MASYSSDPALYIYTSLTAGSSHIVTATSRLETILRANRIPFKAKDMATDEKARMFWGRRAGKDAGGRRRQIPALVQEGLVLGDIVEIEEWNEHRELRQHIKIYYDEHTIPDVEHKYPESQLKKRPVKKAAAKKEAARSQDAQEDKATSKTAETQETQDEERQESAKSVAEEAAQRAKELRLRSLRKQADVEDAAKENARVGGDGTVEEEKKGEETMTTEGVKELKLTGEGSDTTANPGKESETTAEEGGGGSEVKAHEEVREAETAHDGGKEAETTAEEGVGLDAAEGDEKDEEQ